MRIRSVLAPVLTASVLFAVGVLTGCTPDPVYRLRADVPDSTGFWDQGKKVVTHTVDSLQVAVSYARTTNEGHRFRLAFVNRSSEPITVDPLGVYGVVTEKLSARKEGVQRTWYDSTNGTEVTSYVYRRDTLSTADTLYARNPEQVLLNIDKERSRAEADAEEAAGLNALSATLDAVSEIADPPQTPEERTADAAEDAEEDREQAERRARRRRRQSSLGQRRARWAQSALRRTTLTPGMRTSGFVVVPVDPDAYTLVLNVDGDPGVVTVPFRQTRHIP
jgi:hypothetical protein